MKKNNNLKITMNSSSTIKITLPETMDLRYSEILNMFKHMTTQSQVLRVTFDFSENQKIMNSGWVILMDFTRHLGKRNCEYKFINYCQSLQNHLAMLDGYSTKSSLHSQNRQQQAVSF